MSGQVFELALYSVRYMYVGIVTPAPPGSKSGNRVTALRWARIIKGLGHRVAIDEAYRGQSFDLLVALHATRSHRSIRRFRADHAGRPLIVALTGTDLYHDLLNHNRKTSDSLDCADRIVALQPRAAGPLAGRWRKRLRVIYQSVNGRYLTGSETDATRNHEGRGRPFQICVVGHLRPVKDPFRAALAARLLPPSSRITIVHVGRALTQTIEGRARREMTVNPRYKWLGERSQSQTHRIVAASDACVLSSRLEGGANVLSECIVARVPVLASRIDGSIGILGKDYPGFYTTADQQDLARLMIRAETDPKFLNVLRRRCATLAPIFTPAREIAAWQALLVELQAPPG